MHANQSPDTFPPPASNVREVKGRRQRTNLTVFRKHYQLCTQTKCNVVRLHNSY